MKSVRLLCALLVLGFLTSLPVFAQGGGPGTAPWEYWQTTSVPINDFTTATSSIVISDVFTVQELQVMVDIDHPAAGDLKIVLVTPQGSYDLSLYNGGTNDDYQNTIFDMTSTSYPCTGLPVATSAIPGDPINASTNQTSYYRGIYGPQTGTTFVTGNPGAGTWTLQVYDGVVTNQGSLKKWALVFNRYGKYKDVRWGWDINQLFKCGTTTLSRYPYPFVDDVTAYSPSAYMPYSVHGWRPEAGNIYYVGTMQNSKLQSDTRFTLQQKYPDASLSQPEYLEVNLPPGQYSLGMLMPMPTMPGPLQLSGSIFQRGDLYASRNDNTVVNEVKLTAGSLAYDNGIAANTFNTPNADCEVAVFTTSAQQTLTSVDIWHGSDVELEPVSSAARISVRVWNTASGIPTTVIAQALGGQLPLPEQGRKWVTYGFTPPLTLAAGTYAFGLCTDNGPTVGGVSLGVDTQGSPFDEEGFYSRYAGLGTEFWSPDLGTSWIPESFRYFSTKMIRPNFITGSDVGVVKIEMVASFKPRVTFASYANHPYLPNLITIGKVYIKNAAGNTVGYTERRVYLTNAPYITTIDFDDFPSLGTGTYTVEAVIERSDDENFINNSYKRTVVKSFAPVIVSSYGKIAQDLGESIVKNYASIGQKVEFVDRSLSSALPSNGQVLWVGPLSRSEASAVRDFVKNGNSFAILPTSDYGRDIRTEVFSALSNQAEMQQMTTAFMQQKNYTYPSLALSPEVEAFAATGGQISFARTDVERQSNAAMASAMFADLKTRLAAIDRLPKPSIAARPFAWTASDDISVEAERVGTLSVVSVLASKANANRPVVEEIVNPDGFELTQNYPNPFNPTTNIAYNLPQDARVSVRVFDLLGRHITTIVDGTMGAGKYIATWSGLTDARETVASGVYLYRMEAFPVDGSTPYVSTKRMMLTR